MFYSIVTTLDPIESKFSKSVSLIFLLSYARFKLFLIFMLLRRQHEAEVRRKKYRSREHEINRIHSDSFASWFHSQV